MYLSYFTFQCILSNYSTLLVPLCCITKSHFCVCCTFGVNKPFLILMKIFHCDCCWLNLAVVLHSKTKKWFRISVSYTIGTNTTNAFADHCSNTCCLYALTQEGGGVCALQNDETGVETVSQNAGNPPEMSVDRCQQHFNWMTFACAFHQHVT